MQPLLVRIEGSGSQALAIRLVKTAARLRLHARAWKSDEGFVFSCGTSEGQGFVFRLDTSSLHQQDNRWELPRDRFSDYNAAAAGALLRLAGHEPFGSGTASDFELGFEYARANWPVVGTPPQRCEDPLVAMDGEMSIAAALMGSGCSYFAVSAGAPESKARKLLGSLPGRKMRIVEAGDAVAAAFSAAGAGYGGIRAAAEVPDERELLGAPGAAWAASAEVPFVLLVSEPGAPESYGGIVRVPASVVEVYRYCLEAFDLAESYQTSVTLVIEPALRSRWETMVEPAVSATLHRGRWVVPADGSPFDRYADTDDGVSPRSAPGMAGLEHSTNALEGDDAPRRKARIEKLSRKEESLRGAIGAGSILGPGDSTVVIARGTIAAQLRDWVEAGLAPCGLLPIRTLRPFPSEEVAARLAGKRILIAVERTDDSLLRLIRADAGITGAEIWRVPDLSDPSAMMASLAEVASDG